MKAKILRTTVGLLLMFFGASVLADEPTLKFRHMFVLGDSLSDQGNLFSATTALADTFNLPPIPASDHYYRGRFSNGENYAGLLATKLGFTLTPSQLGGGNYAFGGARADYNRVDPACRRSCPTVRIRSVPTRGASTASGKRFSRASSASPIPTGSTSCSPDRMI